MQKKYFFKKKLNNLLISITSRIESFFNLFKDNFFSKKKISNSLNTIDKKKFLGITVIIVAVISFLLIPAFYEETKTKIKLENQILDRYNLEVRLDQNYTYGLFPKPHFLFKKTRILYKSNDVALSENFKVYISFKNFFSLDNLDIKNLVFSKTDFKIKSSNFKFFINLLNLKRSNQNINFNNSKFFYLDKNDEVIFLSNIKKLNYLYQETFLQKLNSKLDIFNSPISLNVEHDIDKKKFFIEADSFPLRLNIKNNSNYTNKKLNGELDLKMINQNIKINFDLEDNFLKFRTKNNNIIGDINIKPFFILLYLNLPRIDLKNIFNENSLLTNILKSETLNNKNLNANINIKASNFTNLHFFKDIKFNILLEEGEILMQNFSTSFKDSVIVNINDTQLIIDDNKIKFAGFIDLKFTNVRKVFEHYQINIKDRKYINKINLAFLFNLDEKFIEIDNLKIDGKINKNLNKFLKNFNKKKENIFNKIVLRNSVKDFFKVISLD